MLIHSLIPGTFTEQLAWAKNWALTKKLSINDGKTAINTHTYLKKEKEKETNINGVPT